MRYLLFLFSFTYCLSMYSSHREKPYLSGSQSLGPVCRRNVSLYEFESQFPVDAKRLHDHLLDELERYKKYISHDSKNSISDKIFFGDLLLQELRIWDGDAHVWGCEDIVKPCQRMCLSCCSCLPRNCVKCPADTYITLVLQAIDNRLHTCSHTISVQERS